MAEFSERGINAGSKNQKCCVAILHEKIEV